MRRLFLCFIIFVLVVPLALPTVAQEEDEDTALEATNRLAYIGWVEELWKEHNVPLWDMFLAPDFVLHSADGDMNSQEFLDSYQQYNIALIPDLTQRWYETIAEGDFVVAPFVIQGTAPADFPFPTADWNAVDIMRVNDGQIAEYWEVIDNLFAYRQWGFIPAEGEQPPVTEALVPLRQQSTLSRAETKALAQQAVDLFESGGSASGIFTPDLVVHLPLSLYPDALDLAGYQDVMSAYQAAFPNFTLTPREDIVPDGLVADANLVAYVYTFSGTFAGELRGLGPLETDVSYPGINIYRMAEGKIAEIWSVWDAYSELTQMQPTATETPSQ